MRVAIIFGLAFVGYCINPEVFLELPKTLSTLSYIVIVLWLCLFVVMDILELYIKKQLCS